MDGAEVWQRVREFARLRLADKQPIFTNDKGVRNVIFAVNATNIERRSDDGTTNSLKVTRNQVERVWAELNGGPPARSILYFTYALLAAALPEVVELTAAGLRLRDRAASTTLDGSIIRARKTGRTFGHVAQPDGNLIVVAPRSETGPSSPRPACTSR